jgi:hypothetical protein
MIIPKLSDTVVPHDLLLTATSYSIQTDAVRDGVIKMHAEDPRTGKSVESDVSRWSFYRFTEHFEKEK